MVPRGANLCWGLGGDNLQFYPNFALFSTLGGMNLDHNLFQVGKLSEDQKKKGLHQKWNTFFPEFRWKPKKKVFTKSGTLFFPEFKWRPALICRPESNYWGDADVDHTQIIGGDTVKLLGGCIPPSPPGIGTPDDPKPKRWVCNSNFRKYLITKLPQLGGIGATFSLSSQATAVYHTQGCFTLLFLMLNVRRKAVITNFYSLWFNSTGNRCQMYRFISRRYIHSTTNRFYGIKQFIAWKWNNWKPRFELILSIFSRP